MAQEDEAGERHREEAMRLRAKVEALVQQARLLLHGDGAGRQPPSQRPMIAKRVEREQELEKALEKTNWYQRELKRLKRELESSVVRVGGNNAMGDPQERDPLELQNLLAEKRKELQRLRKSGEGLDQMQERQRRAEEAQNKVSPENQERLNRIKGEVEVNKRQSVQLFAERQKLVAFRKKLDADVRSAGNELRNKAAPLKLPPRVPTDGYGEPMVLRTLRRDLDILTEAVRQDERKFQAAERTEDQEIDSVSANIQLQQEGIGDHETEVARLRAELRDLGVGPEATPKRLRPPALPSPSEQRSVEAATKEPEVTLTNQMIHPDEPEVTPTHEMAPAAST